MDSLKLKTSCQIFLLIGIIALSSPYFLNANSIEKVSIGLGSLWLFYGAIVYFYFRIEGDVTVKKLHALYREDSGRLASISYFKYFWLYNHVIHAFIAATMIAILFN